MWFRGKLTTVPIYHWNLVKIFKASVRRSLEDIHG
jgi:hypothetical protein